MKAVLLSIGDELLIGQTVNTNVSYIGALLSDNQFTVVRSVVVGDEKTDIFRELDYCSSIADVVICTGGLGPTHDDITRTCVTEYFNTKLVRNDDVYEDIVDRFTRLKRNLNPLNEDQAMVPENATVIRNKVGTAPGYILRKNAVIYIFMPGVPSEMKEMMRTTVIPALQTEQHRDTEYKLRSTLLTTGIAESTLFQKMGNLDELLGDVKLAFLPSQFGVKMRFTVTGKDKEDANNKLVELEQKVRSRIGRFIYGKGEESLSEVLGRLLKERGQTIAVAESCTGGGIANQLTNIPGSSVYFERGIVSYSNAAKVEILNVDEDTLLSAGAVSEEVAIQMALGIRAISGSDIGLSATGILGPSGGTPEKPVGTVFIGIATDKISFAKKIMVGEDRLLNKDRIIQAALDMVRKHLLGIPVEN